MPNLIIILYPCMYKIQLYDTNKTQSVSMTMSNCVPTCVNFCSIDNFQCAMLKYMYWKETVNTNYVLSGTYCADVKTRTFAFSP